MFKVYDLDRRPRSIVTGSLNMATRYWAALIATGGTPICEKYENGQCHRVQMDLMNAFIQKGAAAKS